MSDRVDGDRTSADRTARGGRLLVVAILVLLATAAAGLLTGGGPPPDRAVALERQLRCPVCQQISIADSPAETAAAMRRAVAEQVAAGRTDAEILSWFRGRYGDWVLLDPATGAQGWWWWALPALAAIVGSAAVLGGVRRGAPAPPPLTEAERERVADEVARLRSRSEDPEDAP